MFYSARILGLVLLMTATVRDRWLSAEERYEYNCCDIRHEDIQPAWEGCVCRCDN